MPNRFIQEAIKNVKKGFKGHPAFVYGSFIQPQPNNYSCGPMSLRHCLLKWGVDVDVYEIIRLGSVTRVGSSEQQLELVMWHAGSEYKHFQLNTSVAAKERIDSLLKRGKPLILCVEKWQHWIACIAHTRRGYIILDSSRPGPVIRFRSWKWLQKQMCHVPKGATKPTYSIISVGKPVHWINE
jgi:ABC-type bacteriocin/lantibiotic exporter with double-glycine peptidase domain